MRLLVEVGCEELPATTCDAIAAQLAPDFARLLEAHRLAPPDGEGVRGYVGPRRFALACSVPARQAAETTRHRGPRLSAAFGSDGAPTRAGEGFARSRAMTADELERDGEFVYATVRAESRPAATVVGDLVCRVVDGLALPKTMRWGGGEHRFARPVRWLVALLDDEVLDLELFGLPAGRITHGHRVMSGPIELADADEDGYLAALRDGHVLADQAERRRVVVAALDAAARDEDGGAVRWDDPAHALDEVVHLVEWPTVAVGRFADRFLELPDQVPVQAMQRHQRYFPLFEGGELHPAFLTVLNSRPDPGVRARVVAGNERVLAGRLADARFAVGQDRTLGLTAMAGRTRAITYHRALGSVADRTDRLVALVRRLGGETRAAELAKADLASTLVGEFAELQGYAGSVYARADGEPDWVVAALAEQYLPDGEEARLPQTADGARLALADKLDALAGLFGIGQAPTGSRDPFALRRAGLGVVRILLSGVLGDDPRADRLVEAAVEGYPSGTFDRPADAVRDEVMAFLEARVAFVLSERGVEPEYVAASAVRPSYAARARLAHALAAAAGTPELEAAAQAYQRCVRILPGGGDAPAVEAFGDAAALAARGDGVERDLAAAVLRAGPAVAASADVDLPAALRSAAALRGPVDAFFDGVMVLADDPDDRARRLSIVAATAHAIRPVGLLDRLDRPGR